MSEVRQVMLPLWTRRRIRIFTMRTQVGTTKQWGIAWIYPAGDGTPEGAGPYRYKWITRNHRPIWFPTHTSTRRTS